MNTCLFFLFCFSLINNGQTYISVGRRVWWEAGSWGERQGTCLSRCAFVSLLSMLGAYEGKGELVLWRALWERHSSFSGLPLGLGTLVWWLHERGSREGWEKVRKALISSLTYFQFKVIMTSSIIWGIFFWMQPFSKFIVSSLNAVNQIYTLVLSQHL